MLHCYPTLLPQGVLWFLPWILKEVACLPWSEALGSPKSQPVPKQSSCLSIRANNLLPGSGALRNQTEDRNFDFWVQAEDAL